MCSNHLEGDSNVITESPLNSVSTLFDSEQWVITKNDNGMVKIATCDEDETCMYDKTRDWLIIKKSEDGTEELENELTQDDDIKKDAMFLIRDLLNAKECRGYFILNNIRFRRVFLCGVVTQKNYNEDNYYFQVDDSTSSIRCVISKTYLEDLNTPSPELEPFRDVIINYKEDSDIFLKASNIMLSSINYLQTSTPSWNEIELGDVVKIIGDFSEHNGGRYIFIKKIHKPATQTVALDLYLKNIFELYTETYDNCDDKEIVEKSENCDVAVDDNICHKEIVEKDDNCDLAYDNCDDKEIVEKSENCDVAVDDNICHKEIVEKDDNCDLAVHDNNCLEQIMEKDENCDIGLNDENYC